MSMQEIIPFHADIAAPRTVTPQQKQHRTTLVDAAKLLNEIGWGNQGDIEGMEESVPIRELWLNPFSPIEYSATDVAQMTASLQAQGQLQSITVAYLSDPGKDADGIARGHLMIIDGGLRFLGACGADWDRLTSKVKPYHSMSEVMLELTTAKLSARTLTGIERGRLILRSRLAYERECAMLPEGQEHPMKQAYTQQVLAKRWGCSQATISNWLTLAAEPIAVVELIDSGEINEAQAVELSRIKDQGERIALAQKLAKRNKRKRVPAKKVRATLQLTPEPKPIVYEADTLPYDALWSTHIDEDTAPLVALGCVLHDLRELLGVMRDNRRPHPVLRQLNTASFDPAVTQFLREIEASALDVERAGGNY